MTLQEQIQAYSDMFTTVERSSTGENTTILKNDADEKLHDSIMDAHRDRFPSDFIFGAYADMIQRLTEYTINSIDDVGEYRSEIVDSHVDVYTNKLTEWLASDINNVDYITEALEEFEPKDGLELLSMAQYKAYDDVFSYIYSLLAE